jgi:hypothetical protein
MRRLHPLCALNLLLAAALSGCASTPSSYDYSAFRELRPRSILVLPPTNSSPDVKASYSMLAQLTLPLAESGYYVTPVTLVDETFRQNGVTTPDDAAGVPLEKLHKIFGADAVLYVHVTQYGSVYYLVGSESIVAAEARLVDLRSGALLWEGQARASSAENQAGTSGGIVDVLVAAALQQIADHLIDTSHDVAGITAVRLLTAGSHNGILYGPRSPKYETQ